METDHDVLQKVVFHCETCDYKCCKKQHMDQHKNTIKHKTLFGNQTETQNSTHEICSDCGKKYKNRSGLWKHTKICTVKTNENARSESAKPNENETFILSNIVKELLAHTKELTKQNSESQHLNQELMKQSQELIKQSIEASNKATVIQTTNNTQNNNNKFNINVYLNETCKDAMNFSDFINNIDVSREDLENNVQLGFVNGIAKIFMDNLKQLKEHERPIHCTDVKREIMYIKDNNVWTKQVNDDKLNHAVNIISNKGIKQLMIWKRENPDYQDVNSDFSNKCLDIQLSTMAGYNQRIYNPKVIHVIARETAITRK